MHTVYENALLFSLEYKHVAQWRRPILECAKGGAQRVWDGCQPEVKLFVNKCVREFDVLEEKITKMAKLVSSKIRVGRRGRGRR